MEIEQKQKQVIDHFVKQASSLDGSALGPLVVEVTSHPALFAFSEIIDVPNVLQLEGTENSVYLDVLQLFAHGTWSDYKSDASRLPQLVPDQVLKLKQLTVLTLAETNKTNVDKIAHVVEYVNVLFKNGELSSANTDALISTLKNIEDHQRPCDWTKQKQLKIQGATYVLIRDSKAETSSISIGGERLSALQAKIGDLVRQFLEAKKEEAAVARKSKTTSRRCRTTSIRVGGKYCLKDIAFALAFTFDSFKLVSF